MSALGGLRARRCRLRPGFGRPPDRIRRESDNRQRSCLVRHGPPPTRKHFDFQYGPIFANILLADEINRATPKTQSALLEGMQEGSVTVGGASRPLPPPFFVLATQNPIEMEGTYPLPEAQLDRFLFKLRVRYPALEELNAIIDRTTHATSASVHRVMSGPNVMSFRELIREVPVATHVRDLASMIVMATHPEWERSPEPARRFVRYGASPRGAQALILGAKVRALAEGRYNVSLDDLKALAAPALRHRVILNFEGRPRASTSTPSSARSSRTSRRARRSPGSPSSDDP